MLGLTIFELLIILFGVWDCWMIVWISEWGIAAAIGVKLTSAVWVSSNEN